MNDKSEVAHYANPVNWEKAKRKEPLSSTEPWSGTPGSRIDGMFYFICCLRGTQLSKSDVFNIVNYLLYEEDPAKNNKDEFLTKWNKYREDSGKYFTFGKIKKYCNEYQTPATPKPNNPLQQSNEMDEICERYVVSKEEMKTVEAIRSNEVVVLPKYQFSKLKRSHKILMAIGDAVTQHQHEMNNKK